MTDGNQGVERSGQEQEQIQEEEEINAVQIDSETSKDIGHEDMKGSMSPFVKNGEEGEQREMNNAQMDSETSKSDGHLESDKLVFKDPLSTAKIDESDESDESDEDKEELLVVLELCDFKNHPLFDDYSSATLEGIDTAKPMLKIGEYELYGQLEETVGTTYFYDTDTSGVSNKEYQFAGQTIKKIKFTIAPPEDL
ncbi:Transcription factor TFIIIC, tau55-related [Plasmopara halstedii]|uniref:Transcription factor TFIIIC, tau55-related n=1 Tax=Plasmopara halstedii TaxID=4781 RepID=A0A0P1AGT1_PLAHL|nr:Transcription factor TFIIIC, tau55-related [Plasmopara halstedii]CEG40342.1 Transcription factor TFIIIC, tau55-related [Plasmopara halstedii]|eukprot:XP_024576711.1 Transcription factor TFIIIC, tau55-related [Plasmopara halstedii]